MGAPFVELSLHCDPHPLEVAEVLRTFLDGRPSLLRSRRFTKEVNSTTGLPVAMTVVVVLEIFPLCRTLKKYEKFRGGESSEQSLEIGGLATIPELIFTSEDTE